MPLITVIDNIKQPLGDLLRLELQAADEFRAASAFFNSGGLNIIKPGIEHILQNEGSVHLVHGADFRITEPEAIRDLVELKMRYGNMSYFVHCDWWLTTRHSFHPKLYITTADYRNYCAVIGSSNLTRGGMRENIEVNTVIRGDHSEEPISQCLSAFESILDNVALLEPDLTFVEKYERLHENAERLSLSQEPPYELSDLYQQLIELQSGINQNWRPNAQFEYVIKAMENLSEGRADMYLHWTNICKETERLARKAGKQYKWDTFHNTVRGRLNENTVGKDGRGLFERRGGVTGRFGQYRLSDKGRTYGKNQADLSKMT
jgi:HKD family nuclease